MGVKVKIKLSTAQEDMVVIRSLIQSRHNVMKVRDGHKELISTKEDDDIIDALTKVLDFYGFKDA